MLIRTLTSLEREIVREFYLLMSPDDRRRRFCCTLSDQTISNYVDRMNFDRDTILGAFDEHAHLAGLAELVRAADASELAFSVRPDKRGQKIGTQLMQRLLLCARMSAIGKVSVLFLSDNTPMRRMASRAGMALRQVDGEVRAVRTLPAPRALANRGARAARQPSKIPAPAV